MRLSCSAKHAPTATCPHGDLPHFHRSARRLKECRELAEAEAREMRYDKYGDKASRERLKAEGRLEGGP